MSSKAELRQEFLSRRKRLLPAAEPDLQRHANTVVSELRAGQRLGLYWPLNGEADLRSVANQPCLGQRLALPRVEAGTLTYRCWQPGDTLSPDDTGIQAPATGSALQPEELGLLLVPALAFDTSGIRLGYGGGWFDRLRSDPSWQHVAALAVLPAGCVVPALPRDPWDVPFNGWLDEQGLHWLQAV